MLFVYDNFYSYENNIQKKDVLKLVSKKPITAYLLDNIKPMINQIYGSVDVELRLNIDYEFPSHQQIQIVIKAYGEDADILSDEQWEVISAKEDALFKLISADFKMVNGLRNAFITTV